MLLTLMMQVGMFGKDSHDGGWRKVKAKQVTPDPAREDIHRLVQEAIYGPAKPDLAVVVPKVAMPVPDNATAAKLAVFEAQRDEEEALLALLL